MRHRIRRGVLAAFAGGVLSVPLLTAGGASAQQPAVTYETVVVQLKSPAIRASSVLAGLPGSAPKAAPHARYWMRLPAAEVPSVLSRLQRDGRVNYASVSRAVHATVAPNDPCYLGNPATCGPASVGEFDNQGNMVNDTSVINQDYLNTIGAPAAWDITKGDGQVVAVLDSGVDQANPDLAGKVRNAVNVCGADPQCGDPNNTDDNGHGTHVSGILAADTNNGTGVASLGWNVQVDMYKVLDQDGIGLAMDVATGIYDAVDAGDRVINMSLANFSCPFADSVGHPELCGPDPDEQQAVEYALAHNVVVVAAAGNDGYDAPTYPASYPGVLSVAATDNNGTVQCFSEWGSAANIAAPGLGIVSTWNNSGGFNYFSLDGTSMAAPQVSAAAALMIANRGSLTGPQITQLLEATANPTGGNGDCGPNTNSQPPATHSIYGGVLNVPAALQAESNTPPGRFNGYDMAGSNGGVYPFGTSLFAGDTSHTRLNQPIVGMARTADGLGYWLVAQDGGIFTFGNARFFGSTGAIRLNQPIVGMAEDPATGGYWLVAADGGIFSFNAPFYGSTGAIHLNQPVVGMAAMPDGSGYWLVAKDGGIFTFGNAPYRGSTGAIRLNKPVVGMTPTTSGQGYWLVASDGGIFTFGDAGFYGSTGSIVLNRPMVAMATTPSGHGYWLFASDGGVFTFGDARFYGSLGAAALPAPIVGASD